MPTKRDERRIDRPATPLPEEEPVVEDEGGMQDPDPVTRREAWEQELAEEGRSDEGAEVGEHLD
jgi:hypothetical protein